MTIFKFCPKCGSNLVIKKVRSHNRLVCSNCGFVFFQNPKPSVGVFIVKKGRVLLAKRGIEPKKGLWGIIGGFIEEGESPQEAAIRETKEETNLDIDELEVFGTSKDKYYDVNIVPIAMLARIKSGQMIAQDDVEKLEWFSLNDLPENIAFESTEKALNFLKRKFLK